MSNLINEAECSGVVDKSELTPPQSSPGWPPAEPPTHGRGWPQDAVPGSIFHVLGCECGNCPPDQCKEVAIDSVG